MLEKLKTSIVTIIKLFGIFTICMIVFGGIILHSLFRSVPPSSDFFLYYDELKKAHSEFVAEHGEKPTEIKELAPYTSNMKFRFDNYSDYNKLTETSLKWLYSEDGRNYQHFMVDENRIEGRYKNGKFEYVRTYFFDSEETHSFGIRFK